MKPLSVRVVVGAWIAGSLALGGMAGGAGAADPIKIGWTVPASGPEAEAALPQGKALKLAIKQINESGGIGGRTIELFAEDTKSVPKDAEAAFGRLVDQVKPAAIIGTMKSAKIVAMMPRAMQARVPMIIGGTATRLTLEDSSKYFFRTRPDDSVVAAAMVKYVKETMPGKKVGIIHETNTFGLGGANLIEKAIAESGLKLVKRESFKSGDDARFVPMIRSMKDAGAELVFVYAAQEDVHARLMIKVREMGRPFAYFGSPAAAALPTLAIAKDAANGILSASDTFLGSTPASRKYLAEYEKEYHEAPDTLAAFVYDGMKILAQAMNAVGTDPDKVRDYILHRTKDYAGVMGAYDFDEHGNGLHHCAIVKVEDGKAKLVKMI